MTNVPVDSIYLTRYSGIFQQAGGARQKFMIEKNKLILTDEDNLDKKTLYYTGNHIFFDPQTEIKYRFLADQSGRVNKVNYFDGMVDIVAKRIRNNY